MLRAALAPIALLVLACNARGSASIDASPASSTPASAASSRVAPAASGPDDLTAFVRQYGKPDVDDSTAFDQPQPPLVTRWFIYRKEHVRVTFVPDGEATADGGPARRWDLVSFQDDRTKRAISDAELASRLQARTVSSQ